jgi:hypothetical protein
MALGGNGPQGRSKSASGPKSKSKAIERRARRLLEAAKREGYAIRRVRAATGGLVAGAGRVGGRASRIAARALRGLRGRRTGRLRPPPGPLAKVIRQVEAQLP